MAISLGILTQHFQTYPYILVGGFKHVFFHNIWENPSHWLIYFRGVETTNQYCNHQRWQPKSSHPIINPIKPPFSYGFPMVFLWFSNYKSSHPRPQAREPMCTPKRSLHPVMATSPAVDSATASARPPWPPRGRSSWYKAMASGTWRMDGDMIYGIFREFLGNF